MVTEQAAKDDSETHTVRLTCAANRSNQLIHTICPGVKLTARNAGVDVWDYGIATDKIKRR